MRRRASRRVPLLAALTFTLALAAVCAGATSLPATRDAAHERLLTPGQRALAVIQHGKVARFEVRDAGAPTRLIVQFDAPPLARAGAGRAAASVRIAERASALRADLAAMGGPNAPAAVTRTYERAFSGAAVSVDPAMVARLRALPYVRAIWPDVRMDVGPRDSSAAPPMRIPHVSAAGGTGVRVGIVDTGIDYDHPAFGGGFGPGHRVAGGWDFVNGDAEPRDDNGHGTHVAGIVGGNGGGVTGVAPGVTLYAIKVFDANGRAYTSDILAGFEFVLDPDGNPATDDHLDVVNMSFGGPGRTDDPMAQAVENLIAQGVICCVAAGNDYDYFQIGSPGCAPHAITVGASDGMGGRAYFSSRGPALDSLVVKPDLLAPGMNIVSAWPGGGTAMLSGTSMATPFVTGAAALLHQTYPDWAPDVVKAALAEHSHDLGLPPLDQGAGEADPATAMDARVVATPANVTFDWQDGLAPQVSITRSVTLRNLRGTPIGVRFPHTLNLAPGVVVTALDDTISLAPGDTAVAHLQLSLDNAVAPFPAAQPYAFSGTVLATTNLYTLRIPVAVFKSARLTVQGSTTPDMVMIGDPGRGSFVPKYLWLPLHMMIAPGQYDVMASILPEFHLVMHPGVNVSGETVVDLEPEEATSVYTFHNVDAQGQPITCDSGALVVTYPDQRDGFGYIGAIFDEARFSPATTDMVLSWRRSDTDWSTYVRSFAGTAPAFGASRTITNVPADVHHVHVTFPAARADSVRRVFWSYYGNPADSNYFGLGIGTTVAPSERSFDFDLAPGTGCGWSGLSHRFDLYPKPTAGVAFSYDSLLFRSANVRIDRGWPLVLDPGDMLTPTTLPPFGGRELDLSGRLPVWNGSFLNSTGVLALENANPSLYRHLITDVYGSATREADPPFTIRRGGTTLLAGTLSGSGALGWNLPFFVTFAGTDPCDFHTSSAYTLLRRAGRLDVQAHLINSGPDPNPPALASLQVRADSVATDSIAFATATAPMLDVVLRDGNAVTATARAWDANTGWRTLDLHAQDGRWTAALPGDLDGDVTLELSASDPAGNAITFKWTPAFVALADPAQVPTVPPGTAAFALVGPRPNPTTGASISLVCSLVAGAPATASLYDVGGRLVLSRRLPSPAGGPQFLRLTPDRALRSGMYFARLEQGGRMHTARVCVVR